jgi:hypothetical protein
LPVSGGRFSVNTEGGRSGHSDVTASKWQRKRAQLLGKSPTNATERDPKGSTPEVTHANAWRYGYSRPADVYSTGKAPPPAVVEVQETGTSREQQAEQHRRTGFVQRSELGHAVVAALLRRGYPHTVALVAGHLAAVASVYNWQGNTRIAELMRRSPRTVQRARARLEADKLIRSRLLLTGDYVAGQRRPVRHPQVVRDVRRLQQLARMAWHSHRPNASTLRRKRHAAASPPPAVVVGTGGDRVSHAEIIAFAASLAKAPPNAATVNVEELEAVERELVELERELVELDRSKPAAPERGPPPPRR